jgi:hypothetical protein
MLYRRGRDLFHRRIAALDMGGDFEAYRAACAEEYKDRLV